MRACSRALEFATRILDTDLRGLRGGTLNGPSSQSAQPAYAESALSEPIRKLLRDRVRQRIGDHRHVSRRGALRHERLCLIAGSLRVDDGLERQHVRLHQL